MNILIADDNTIYRLGLKSYLHELWPQAMVYEESSLDSVVRDVFDIDYDLLILATDVPGNRQLADFVKQAVKYTKVIIFYNDQENGLKVKQFVDIGAHAVISKSATESEVKSNLLFVFNAA